MGQLLLFIVVAFVVAAIVFGVTVMVGGGDSGLTPVEPDGRSAPLPSDRPLGEEDVFRTRFDTAWRGYRMSQVDQALQRAAYDIGYKGELIGVLEAEVAALREGRTADADVLRRAREAAVAPPPAAPPEDETPVIVLPDVVPPTAAKADLKADKKADDQADEKKPAELEKADSEPAEQR
jgi:DivIVA domain-containing protein